VILGHIPIVSLDKIYFRGENESEFLDCTRLENSNELVSRKNPNDAGSVERQIEKIAAKLRKNGNQEIILVDDVVFSGNVLRKIIERFRQRGITVIGIRAALSTEESYKYFDEILEKGLKCGCLLGKDVIDQICERDFYFGIVQSGISTISENEEILKSPYFKPFGNPIERASIPQKYEEFFSNGCLLRSMYLWKCIEENSKRKIYIKDLPEGIINTNKEERIINVLRKGLIYDEKDTNRDYGECR